MARPLRREPSQSAADTSHLDSFINLSHLTGAAYAYEVRTIYTIEGLDRLNSHFGAMLWDALGKFEGNE